MRDSSDCGAATAPRGTLLDTDLALWEEIMAVNLRGPFLTMQRTVRALKEAGAPGSIVSTPSSRLNSTSCCLMRTLLSRQRRFR